MKIIIRDNEKKDLFTFDVGEGKAEISPGVEMDDVARTFVRGIETVLLGAKNGGGKKFRDLILEFGGGENCGDFYIITGNGAEGGAGGDIRIEVPKDGSYVEIGPEGNQ